MDERAFLSGVARTLGCDERRAEGIVFAVFGELRDRLSPEERHDVQAQLPIPLKRLWEAGERRDAPANRIHRDEFIGRVRQRAVLPDDEEAGRATRAVFAQLQLLLGSPTGREGEAWDVYSQLPKDLKHLWLDAARRSDVAPDGGTHPIRKIIVGTDFSSESGQAVAYAGDLAKALDAGLTVVHVDEKAAFVPGSDLARAEYASDRASIDAVVVELVQRNVRARAVLRAGLPPEGLCDLAREEKADLIVVGTQGRSCLANVVLGSVAEQVLRDAPCAVLVVRNP